MRAMATIGSLIAGSLTLAGCVAPAPDAGQSPSAAPATAASSEAAASEPAVTSLRWESALTLSDLHVVSIAATQVGTFVVASRPRAGQCDPTPMWSGGVGSPLAPMDVDGLLGAKASVMQVVAGGPGVVAVGCLPDPDRLVVWTSVDGSTWTVSETGYPMPIGDTRLSLRSIAAGPERAILTGSEFRDIMSSVAAIEDAANATMPRALLPFAETGILVQPQSASMSVGPFTALTATLDELGVDPQIGVDYQAAMNQQEVPVTITTDGYRQWAISHESPLPDFDPRAVQIVATTDGFLATAGDFTTDDSKVFASSVGTNWTQVDFPETKGVRPPTTSGERAVVAANPFDGEASLWSTDDLGTTWTELKPAPGTPWSSPTIGPLGLLTATSVEGPGSEPLELTFSRGSAELLIRLGMDGGSVRLDDAGRTIVDEPVSGDWRMATAPASFVFDNKAGKVNIIDADTGKKLFSVTYADLESAFTKAVADRGVGAVTAGFSADGLTWSEAPLPDTPDRFSGVSSMVVGTDSAWMAVDHAFGESQVLRGSPSGEETS